MNIIDINLKLTDALISAQIKAQDMAERNDFAEKYHNGRADAFAEACNIVEQVLLKDDEDKSKNDLHEQRKKAASIILDLRGQKFDNDYITKVINDNYPELKMTAQDIFELEKAHSL